MSYCLNDMQTSNEQTWEMFQAQKYVVLMLQRRGYDVVEQPWHIDYKHFLHVWSTYASYTAFTIVGTKEGGQPIIVFWPFEQKLRINSIRDILAICKEKKYYHTIIVYSGTITSFAKQQLSIIKSKKSENPVRIETFNIQHFLYDIFEHQYVPQQRALTHEETTKLLDKYKITLDDLPKIYTTDPIAKYFGLRPKRVLHCLYPSPEGYFYSQWRVCVKGNIMK